MILCSSPLVLENTPFFPAMNLNILAYFQILMRPPLTPPSIVQEYFEMPPVSRLVGTGLAMFHPRESNEIVESSWNLPFKEIEIIEEKCCLAA